MLFDSLTYYLFLPIVFIIYWNLSELPFVDSRILCKSQNIFLICASLFFYGWWDYRFLGLLLLMVCTTWVSSLYIERFKHNKCNNGTIIKPETILALTIVFNLSFLIFFKYFDFFVDSFINVFSLELSRPVLNLILPLGISFYTFQSIAYIVDVYRGRIACRDNIDDPLIDSFIHTALYLVFFPKLLAGPLEKPVNIMPQIRRQREFDYDSIVDGSRQILWGLFKKIVVADGCAIYVNAVYSDWANQSGSTLLLSAILFSIQIYGDFSGYSDIAIGSARILGFSLSDNFRFPYFSRNMAEFWRQWHISLNQWFMDYVYLPLGGGRRGRWRKVLNTMIVFLLSGLWHGADFSFILWGGYHGVLVSILFLLGIKTKYDHCIASNGLWQSFKEILQMILVFVLSTIGWIMFRADDIMSFWGYICGIFDSSLLTIPWLKNRMFYIPLAIMIVVMFVVEWIQRRKKHGLELSYVRYFSIRYPIYCFVIAAILYYSFQVGKEQSFIYLHF